MERSIETALLDKMLSALRKACDGNDDDAVMRQIRNLVPEFRPADEVNREGVRQAVVNTQAANGAPSTPERPAFLATGP
jgi:hypothetical protein